MTVTANATFCTQCGHELTAKALFCPACGTPRSQATDADPLIGQVIGQRFLVVERMGHGESGTIYRGEHTTLRRKVAIKVLHPELCRDELAVERFRREAITVSDIDNDHIVEIHDFGRTPDERLYLVMELLEGETLRDAIGRDEQLPVDKVVDILIQLGEALTEAHAMGYVHRDLRPRNIYLAIRRGRANYVKLLDFGLAKLVENESQGAATTTLGMKFGDPKYMSPEQARGETVDRRADIYSLGCIAYEMLIGHPPFATGKSMEILARQVDSVPERPQALRSDVPGWLDATVMRMLAKQPDERFITVFRMVEALRQGLQTGEAMSDELARRRETIQPPVGSRSGVPVPAADSAPAEPSGTGERTESEPAKKPAETPEKKPAKKSVAVTMIGTALDDPRPADQPKATGAARVESSAGAEASPDDSESIDSSAASASASEPGGESGDEPGDRSGDEMANDGPESGSAADQSATADASADGPADGQSGAEKPADGKGIGGITARGTAVAAPARVNEERSGAAAKPDLKTDASAPPEPADVSSSSAASEPAGQASESGDESGDESDSDERSSSDESDSDRDGRTDLDVHHPDVDPGDSAMGLSGAWFADGDRKDDDELDDRLERKLAAARENVARDATDTFDDLYVDDSRRRLLIIGGIIGGLVLLIIVVALAWPSDSKKKAEDKSDEPSATAADVLAKLDRPDAGPTTIDAGAAPDAAGTDPTGQKPGHDSGQKPGDPGTDPGGKKPGGDTQPPGGKKPGGKKPGGKKPGGKNPGGKNPGGKKPGGKKLSPQEVQQAAFFAKIGTTHLRNNNLGQASDTFDKALAINPRDVDAIIGKGEVALKRGKTGLAIKTLKKAAGMKRSARVYSLLGDAFMRTGNPQRAADNYKKALRIDPDNKKARDGYTAAAKLIPPPPDEDDDDDAP